MLRFGNAHRETFDFRANDETAAHAAGGLDHDRKIEHLDFEFRLGQQTVGPRRVNADVTRCTAASAGTGRRGGG